MITPRNDDYYRPRLHAAGVPVHLHDGLLNYLVRRLQPGHFLTAVLENNLVNAVGRADALSVQALPQCVRFLYGSAPAPAWGSFEKVTAWLQQPESEWQ